MPTHVYKPVHSPPSWWDRLLVHPLDTTVAVVSILFGALVTLSLSLPSFTPSNSLASMPLWIAAPMAVFFTSGGVLALVGLNWWGDVVSFGWALERFGWLLAAGGLLTYAISVSWHFPESVFSWGVPLALGLGGLLRFGSLVMIERATRTTIAEVKGETL